MRIRSVDGLRGLAVLLVFFAHASIRGIPPLEGQFAQMGKAGVYLFFVLSAWLLDRQILNAFDDGNVIYWKRYFYRRFMRIFPMFTISLVLYYLYSFTGGEIIIGSKDSIVDHLTLQRGDRMYWSIPVEFKYYFFSPAIMYVVWKIRHNAYLTLLFFLALIFISMLLQSYFLFDRTSTIRYLPVFLVGTYLATYSIDVSDRILRLTPALLFLSFLGAWAHHPRFYPIWGIIWGAVLLSSLKKSTFTAILESNVLCFLGKISFSLYLLHHLCFDIARRIDPGPAFELSLGIGLTLLVSILGHRIEKTFLKFSTF